jgi:hypothetical protein
VGEEACFLGRLRKDLSGSIRLFLWFGQGPDLCVVLITCLIFLSGLYGGTVYQKAKICSTITSESNLADGVVDEASVSSSKLGMIPCRGAGEAYRWKFTRTFT